MRLSKYYMPTLREDPVDAETASHKFLTRGAFIRKQASGVYSFLPLGKKVINKIEAIVREAMENHEMSAGQSRLERFAESFDLTEREQEVLQLLLLSDDGMQEIADSLFVSRAMLYRHIAALNEKTGTRSRIGLIQFYYNWEEDKK